MTALLDSKLQLSLVMKIDSPVNRAFRVGCSCKRCFRPLPTDRLLVAARCEESRNRLSFTRYAFYHSSLRLSSSITTIVKNALKRRKGETLPLHNNDSWLLLKDILDKRPLSQWLFSFLFLPDFEKMLKQCQNLNSTISIFFLELFLFQLLFYNLCCLNYA